MGAAILGADTPRKFKNQVVINFGAPSWKARQLDNPVVIQNPKNSSQLIMFYNGMDAGGTDRIGIATANVSDPYTWTENPSNPLYGPSYVRVNSVIYNAATDEYWIYYSAGLGGGVINLMTVPTGSDGYSNVTTANLVQYGSNPVLTTGGGRADETVVDEGCVWQEDSTHWYMYYGYRTASLTLPGIRLATSSDGKTWTKQTASELFTAVSGNFYEFHSIRKIGSLYILAIEVGLNAGGRWQHQFATSTAPGLGAWTLQPLSTENQVGWPGYTSALYNCATPFFVTINGTDYLFYTATAGPVANYNNSNWAMYAVNCQQAITVAGATLHIPTQTVSTVLNTLTAYYAFEDINFFDQVQGFTLTNHGTATVVAGKIGNAVNLVAASSQYLSVADNARLEAGSNDFCWFGWVKLTDKAAHYAIAGRHDGTTAAGSEWLVSYNNTDDRFTFELYNGGSSVKVDANNLGSPVAGTWYFIAAWSDRTANTANIQVNNGSIDSAAWSTGVNVTTQPLLIGAVNSPGLYFNGLIDEAGLCISATGSGAVLSAAQKTALYNAGAGVSWPLRNIP